MMGNYFKLIERFLKRNMKKKLRINEGFVITFLITGLFSLSTDTFAQVKYVSVQSGATANSNNDGATANGAIAIGPNAKSSAVSAVALGANTNSASLNGIAIGNGANLLETQVNKTGSSNSVAIGAKANVEGQKSIALGYEAKVKAEKYNEASGVAIGDNATVEAKNSIALGHFAKAVTSGQGSAMALGDQAQALNEYAVAMGTLAEAKEYGSLAMAYRSKAYAKYSIALGFDSLANADGALAMAFKSQALNKNSIALGVNSLAGKNGGYGEIAIGSNTNATGERSVAIGDQSNAKGDRSLTIGNEALTGEDSTDSTAIGRKAVVGGTGSTAVGFGAEVGKITRSGSTVTIDETVKNATAIGTSAKAKADYSTALGNNANAEGLNSLATGNSAQATGDYSIATGNNSKATGLNSSATGNSAQAIGKYSIANGDNSSAKGNYSTALGEGTEATGNYTLAVGNKSIATPHYSLAIGNSVQAGETGSGYRAVVIGNESKALANDSIVLGTANNATGNASIGIGRNISNSSSSGIAMGDTVNLSGNRSIGIGRNIEVSSVDSIAIGHNNYITTNNTHVLGSGIGETSDRTKVGTVENSVYLGNNSTIVTGTEAEIVAGTLYNKTKDYEDGLTTTAGALGIVNSAIVNKIEYSGFAGGSSSGAISVGSSGEERRIVNLAAGEISETSTDAINGSQLYMTNKVLGNAIDTLTVDVLGGNAEYESSGDGAGKLTFTDIGGTGKSTIHDAIKASREEVESEDGSVDVIEKLGANGQTIYDLSVATTTLTSSEDKKIVNAGDEGNKFATAKTVADAINTAVKAAATEVESSDNSISVVATTGTDGQTIYDLKVEKSELTISEDGKIVTSGTSGNAFVTGDNVSKIVNKVVASARTELADGKNTTVVAQSGADGQDIYKVNVEGDLTDISSISNGDTKISLGTDTSGNKTVDIDGAKITNVAAGTADTDAVNVSQLNKAVATLKVEVESEDGSVDVIEKLGENGEKIYDLSVATTTLTSSEDKKTVNAGDEGNKFATAKTVADAINTAVKAATTEVESSDNSISVVATTGTDGQTIYDLQVEKSELTISEDGKIVTSGTSGNAFVTGDNVSRIVNKATSSARTELADGKNTTVVAQSGADGQDIYKVNVEGDLTDISSISNGDTKISLGTDTSGNKTVDIDGAKITNVAAGTADTDAVNVSQLKETKQDIYNRIDDLDDSTRRGIAGAMAQAGVKFQEQGINQVVVGAAASFYRGTGAVAVGVQGAPTENTRVHSIVSLSPGSRTNAGITVGGSWKFNIK